MNEKLESTIARLPGWCSVKKAQVLHDLIISSKAKVSVELGCFGMRATLAMAAAHKEVGGMCFGIDAYAIEPCLEGAGNSDNDKYWSTEVDFNGVYDKGIKAIIENELSNFVTIRKFRTDEAIKEFTEIDVLFVDANATPECTLKDIEMYAPLISKGGYLVMNNSDWGTKLESKKLLPTLGFEIAEVWKESCCGEFTVYKNTGVKAEFKSPVIESDLVKVTHTKTDSNVYDPNSQKPCYPIPETPIDIALRGGMQIGSLKVQPMLLYLPDTTSFVERWQRSMEHFKEAGLENIIEVAGIHGTRFGIDGVHTYDVDNPGEGYRIGPGYTAQFLSVYLMYSIANCLPFEHFMFLECDAKLKPDYLHHLAKELENVPADFDWLWVGSCHLKNHGHKHVKGNVYEFDKSTGYGHCGHNFIVSKKAIPYIIQTQRDCYAPSDLSLIFHTFPSLKVYGILPRLSEQFNNDLPE